MSTKQSQTLLLRPDVVGTVVEDGAVLLDLASNFFYEVNSTGWAILQMFEGGTTLELVMEQCGRWNASAADVDALTRFLDTVVGEKLVTESDWPVSTAAVSFNAPWIAPLIQKAPEALQRIVRSAFDPTLPLAE